MDSCLAPSDWAVISAVLSPRMDAWAVGMATDAFLIRRRIWVSVALSGAGLV